ncbi:MAG: hypothetical protein K5683_08745 [Prevotella sp.]|nr:hypothetical protein [Prevotella sp.]
MNYEEMLNAQGNNPLNHEEIPLGEFYRKQVDQKYRNVVELKSDLTENLVFCEALRRDQQLSRQLDDPHQLKYELWEDSGGIYELELQAGSYQTLSKLLADNPAVVADRGFIEQIVTGLMELTEKLHERGIFHLCYDPKTVFVRKSDNAPMLLCHGSLFSSMRNLRLLFEDCESSVAPEVLSDGQMDERSDVFALGKLIERLYESGDMPYEYKGVVKKATSDDPEKRYSSVVAMRKSLTEKRSMKRSVWMLIGAVAVVGLLVFLYFDLTPESSNVEFVDGNGVQKRVDPFSVDYDEPFENDQEEYIDPEIALYLDSIQPMSEEEVKRISDSLNVASSQEKIFRRRFEQHANSKLSTLYSSSNMGSSEADFVSRSQGVMSELMDYAAKLSEETGLPREACDVLASQVISRIQAQLQQNVKHYGSMTEPGNDE